MIKQQVAVALAAIIFSEPVAAAKREVIKTDWNGFQQQVSARKLKGRSVRISLTGGGGVKTNLLEVTDTGLVARANRTTKQWKSGKDKAQIPKDQIASVRFGGRVGHGGLIGGLVGSGAGAGIAAAIFVPMTIEGDFIILILISLAGVALMVVGGITGYFVGGSFSRPAPEFVLTQ
jgi:hypothetical protein